MGILNYLSKCFRKNRRDLFYGRQDIYRIVVQRKLRNAESAQVPEIFFKYANFFDNLYAGESCNPSRSLALIVQEKPITPEILKRVKQTRILSLRRKISNQ